MSLLEKAKTAGLLHCPFCGEYPDRTAIGMLYHRPSICMLGNMTFSLDNWQYRPSEDKILGDVKKLRDALQNIRYKWQTFDRGYSDYNQGYDDALAECDDIAEEAMRGLS